MRSTVFRKMIMAKREKKMADANTERTKQGGLYQTIKSIFSRYILIIIHFFSFFFLTSFILISILVIVFSVSVPRLSFLARYYEVLICISNIYAVRH